MSWMKNKHFPIGSAKPKTKKPQSIAQNKEQTANDRAADARRRLDNLLTDKQNEYELREEWNKH